MIFGLAFLFWGASGFQVSGFWCLGLGGFCALGLTLTRESSKIPTEHSFRRELLAGSWEWDAMLVLLVLLHCGYG